MLACTYPYSTVTVFRRPSGIRMVSSMSVGVESEALSFTDPFTLPLAAPGGWEAWRGIVDVILFLLVTAFKLQIKNGETWNKLKIHEVTIGFFSSFCKCPCSLSDGSDHVTQRRYQANHLKPQASPRHGIKQNWYKYQLE